MCAVRYAFRVGRHTMKEAVTQRNGAAYSSTCLSSKGSAGALSLELDSLCCCDCDLFLDFESDTAGGVLCSSTFSYASTTPFAGGKYVRSSGDSTVAHTAEKGSARHEGGMQTYCDMRSM